jgi:hypothetical protein
MAVARLAGTVDFPRVCGGILNHTQTDRPAVSSPLPDQRRLIHLFKHYCLVADEEEDRQQRRCLVTKARSCVGCQRQEAAPTAPCRLAAHHSGHRRSLFSMTRNGQLDWSLDAREGTRRCTKTGLPEPSLHSTRSNTLSPRHPLGEKQLLLPISPILLQVGRLRWTTASQGDSHLQGCIAGASRALLHAQAHGQALCCVACWNSNR